MRIRTELVAVLLLGATVLTPKIAKGQFLFSEGSNSVEGDYLQGLGIAAEGIGAGAVLMAEAESIQTDTWIRFNEYVSSVLERENERNAQHRKAQQTRRLKHYSAIRDRIQNSPEAHDVDKGDALNAVLKELNSGRIQDSLHRYPHIPLTSDEIRSIPFKLTESGPQGFSLSRLNLKQKGKWPPAFQDPRFDGLRRRYEDALDVVLEQEIDGQMHLAAIDKLSVTIQDLSDALALTFKNRPNDRRHIEAAQRIRELKSTVEMLKTHKLQLVLRDLELFAGSTIDDLRILMRKHRLQFADAATPEERILYPGLYTRLKAHHDMVTEGLDDSEVR